MCLSGFISPLYFEWENKKLLIVSSSWYDDPDIHVELECVGNSIEKHDIHR
jgi:hypothetical protein